MNSEQLRRALEWLRDNEEIALYWFDGVIDTDEAVEHFEAQSEERSRPEIIPDNTKVVHIIKDDAGISLSWTVDQVMEMNVSCGDELADVMGNFFFITSVKCFFEAARDNPEYFSTISVGEMLSIVSFISTQLTGSVASDKTELARRLADRYALDETKIREHAYLVYFVLSKMDSANG